MRDVLNSLTSAGSAAALLLPQGSSRFTPAFAASYNAAAGAALSATKVAALVHAQRIDEELSEVQGRASPTSDSVSSGSGFATPMSTLQDDAESVSSAPVAVSPSPIHSRSEEGDIGTPLPQATAGMGSAVCFDTPALPSGAIFAQQHVPQWRAGGPVLHRAGDGSLQLSFDGDHVVPDALSKALKTAFPMLLQATMHDAHMIETGDAGEHWTITGKDNDVIMCRGEGFGSPKPVMKVPSPLPALVHVNSHTTL